MKNEKIKQKLLQQKQRIKAQNNVLMKIIGEIKNPKPTIEIKLSLSESKGYHVG